MKHDAIIQKILKRVRGKGKGWVFTPKDFLDLGNRANVDVSLHHLSNSNIMESTITQKHIQNSGFLALTRYR